MTLINTTTGREAYTGPMGEPGSATPFPGATQWQNPVNGQTMYYVAGSTPDPGNIAALAAAGYTPASVVGTYEGYPENPGGGPAVGFPGSAPLGAGPQGPGTVQGGSGGSATQKPPQDPQAGADANGIIAQYLQQIGITDPSAMAWASGLITSGASAAQIEVQMYDQPWFKARFPGIFQRQGAGLPPISPAEYISYEDQAKQLENAFGLPTGYLDNKDWLGNQIGQDVSMAELQDRVEKGFAVVNTAPQEVRDSFGQLYGASGDAALAAYVMDPTRSVPLLEKQVLAAQNAGAGLEQGFNATKPQAEQMAGMGISYGQAQQGFSNLQGLKPFFTPGVGESNTEDINRTGINAQFGLDATSQAALARIQAQRRAEFEGSASPVESAQGLVGAGAQRAF